MPFFQAFFVALGNGFFVLNYAGLFSNITCYLSIFAAFIALRRRPHPELPRRKFNSPLGA